MLFEQAKFRFSTMAMMVLFFSVTTPVGIVLGIGISRIYHENGPTALIVEGVFDAASAGILIYMALVDLLAADFMNPRLQSSLRLQLGANISLLLGTGCMSFLAKWAWWVLINFDVRLNVNLRLFFLVSVFGFIYSRTHTKICKWWFLSKQMEPKVKFSLDFSSLFCQHKAMESHDEKAFFMILYVNKDTYITIRNDLDAPRKLYSTLVFGPLTCSKMPLTTTTTFHIPWAFRVFFSLVRNNYTDNNINLNSHFHHL